MKLALAAVPGHQVRLEDIVTELLDGLRRATTVEEVNIAAGIAHEHMAALLPHTE